MLFNSFEFLLFFPIVTILFFLVPQKWRWLHLLIASCVFYMAFIPVYILILVFTVVVDYFAGILIEKSTGRKRKFFLAWSIVANVGILGFFKYFNFFIDNVNRVFHLSAGHQLHFLYILLPIGLSFHTFQAMSYTIEVYRGKQKAERHFGIYALYVLFYPQLVAGPIERPQNLLPQFREKKEYDPQRVYEGLKLMLWGLFKKVVIADRLAIYVNEVYGNIPGWPGANLVLATLFFAIQIYCDFSGYSDMAIGSAKVMGFRLMTNFNRPYFSKNIREFWKRWHISLSTWFRDYLYIPLGGNRRSGARMYLNILFVFLISGFWHGASWTFVIWGCFHAILVIGYMLYRQYIRKKSSSSWWGNILSVLLTFLLVGFAWIFFRAKNMHEASLVIHKIVHADFAHFKLYYTPVSSFGYFSALISLITITIMFLNERLQNVQLTTINKKPVLDVLFNSVILFSIITFGVFQNTNFIYFQF